MKTYTSKLGIGDTAWFMRDNKTVSMPVASVKIHSVCNELGQLSHESVIYGFRIYDGSHRFKEWLEIYEAQVFATKEELLASL